MNRVGLIVIAEKLALRDIAEYYGGKYYYRAPMTKNTYVSARWLYNRVKGIRKQNSMLLKNYLKKKI